MAGDEILQLTQSDPPAPLEEGMGPLEKQHAGGFVAGLAHLPCLRQLVYGKRVILELVLQCRKTHLATYLKAWKAISSEQTISAGDGFSRDRAWPAVAGSFGLSASER